MGKIYHYYSCPNKACKFSISRDEGQKAFLEFLKKVKPSRALLKLFREVVLEQWHKRYRMLTSESTTQKQRAQALQDEKARLVALMKQHFDNAELMAELKADFERVSREYSLALSERNEKETEHLDAEEVVKHCIYFLEHAHKLWAKAPVEDKYRLQSLIFPEGVTYDALIGKQTPKLSPVYEAIQALENGEKRMAAPGGFEPPLAD